MFKKDKKLREKHLRRYIVLSVVLFTLVFFLHAWRLLANLDSNIGGIAVSPITSVFALIITASMVFMGAYYIIKK